VIEATGSADRDRRQTDDGVAKDFDGKPMDSLFCRLERPVSRGSGFKPQED
jgi:hypothetical protein